MLKYNLVVSKILVEYCRADANVPVIVIPWNGPATNNPIFAEIVPEKSRTSVYALDRSFESILASFAPPVVGLLAQHVYGYKPIPKGASSSVEIETDRENALSLAKALYTAIGIPMAICCFIYSFLYLTYPRDRDSAKLYTLIESEMEKLDTYRDSSQNRLSESGKEVNGGNETSVLDMEYRGEDIHVDLDNSDETYLLSHQTNSSSS